MPCKRRDWCSVWVSSIFVRPFNVKYMTEIYAPATPVSGNGIWNRLEQATNLKDFCVLPWLIQTLTAIARHLPTFCSHDWGIRIVLEKPAYTPDLLWQMLLMEFFKEAGVPEWPWSTWIYGRHRSHCLETWSSITPDLRGFTSQFHRRIPNHIWRRLVAKYS